MVLRVSITRTLKELGHLIASHPCVCLPTCAILDELPGGLQAALVVKLAQSEGCDRQWAACAGYCAAQFGNIGARVLANSRIHLVAQASVALPEMVSTHGSLHSKHAVGLLRALGAFPHAPRRITTARRVDALIQHAAVGVRHARVNLRASHNSGLHARVTRRVSVESLLGERHVAGSPDQKARKILKMLYDFMLRSNVCSLIDVSHTVKQCYATQL